MTEAVDSLGFSIDRQTQASHLFRTRLQVRFLRILAFLAVVAVLLAGGSRGLRDATRQGSTAVAVFGYVSLLYVLLGVLAIPFSAYEHVLERRYGLTRQRWRRWGVDMMKSGSFGYGVSLLAVEVLYYLLRESPADWWIAAWLLGVGVGALGAVVAPVVLIRLFFRLERLADPDLEARFESLAARAHVPVLGVFVLRASEKTRRSNAALAGVGGTRRIIVTDTLLQDHTPDEIEAILAHELAHQKHRDPIVGFGVFAAVSFVTLAVLRSTLPRLVGPLDLEGIADVAGLPAVMVLIAALSAAVGPLDLAFSRWREDRADRFALTLTGNRGAFAAAMIKLHDANLSPARPPRLFEVLAMSHPAAWRRVARARASQGASP